MKYECKSIMNIVETKRMVTANFNYKHMTRRICTHLVSWDSTPSNRCLQQPARLLRSRIVLNSNCSFYVCCSQTTLFAGMFHHESLCDIRYHKRWCTHPRCGISSASLKTKVKLERILLRCYRGSGSALLIYCSDIFTIEFQHQLISAWRLIIPSEFQLNYFYLFRPWKQYISTYPFIVEKCNKLFIKLMKKYTNQIFPVLEERNKQFQPISLNVFIVSKFHKWLRFLA